MIVKIIIIGRYFFHRVFPDYEHHKLSIKTDDFPMKDDKMTQFIEHFLMQMIYAYSLETIMGKYVMK